MQMRAAQNVTHEQEVNSGPVTTHWEDQAELAALFPALEVVNGPRWVEQARIITSAGIAAGIESNRSSDGLSLENLMAIELDHAIVSARNRDESAQQLAHLLGVPCGPAKEGPFFAVYVNDGLTLDFIAADEPFPVAHFCFRVSDQEFDSILGRIQSAGIPYRSTVRGPIDGRVNTFYGGKMIYWNVPEGHQWEILTVSYARAP